MTDICRSIAKTNSHDPNVASFLRDNSGFRTSCSEAHPCCVDSDAVCMMLRFIVFHI